MDWMFKETMEECRFDGVVSEELDCTDGAVEGSSLLGTAQGGRISFVACSCCCCWRLALIAAISWLNIKFIDLTSSRNSKKWSLGDGAVAEDFGAVAEAFGAWFFWLRWFFPLLRGCFSETGFVGSFRLVPLIWCTKEQDSLVQHRFWNECLHRVGWK